MELRGDHELLDNVNKLENMVSKIDQVRLNFRLMFESLATYASGGKNLEKIKQEALTIRDLLQKLSIEAKEVEGLLVPVGSANFGDLDSASLYENISNQFDHHETRIRSEIAMKKLEELNCDFPEISMPFKKRKLQDLESLLETVKGESLQEMDKILSEIEKTAKNIKIKKIIDINVPLSIQLSTTSPISPFFLSPTSQMSPTGIASAMDTSQRESTIPPTQSKEITNVIGLKVRCNGIFKAMISFRITTSLTGNIQIEKIAVFGLGEKQKKSFLDQSDLLVFQRITEQANKALNFFTLSSPQSILKKLILWISTYKNLFTQECSKCNKVIRNDGTYLPPIYRDYETGVAFHLQCFDK